MDADGTAFGQAGSHPVRWSTDGTVTDMALPTGYPAGEVTLLNDHGVVMGEYDARCCGREAMRPACRVVGAAS